MLGFEDKWVALVYWLCIGSALLCLVYGLINWNRGEQEINPEDVDWASEEDKVDEKL